jgi:hypothetical protein
VEEPRPAHQASIWLFLRLLGLVYLVAFASLFVQVDGLFGSRGVAPMAPWLEWVGTELGPERFLRVPTVLWLGASDASLRLACGLGALAAVLVVLDLAPALGLLAAYALYLSLVRGGQEFMSFQWDSLLLEAGFLAIFVAPWSLRPARRTPREPPALGRWLLGFLLFRLVFSSGVVKLASGDPAWRSLDALRFHYETQPLPTWVGWYAHQLPAALQRSCCAFMFAIELGAPFLLFGPRRLRQVAVALLVLLQTAIALTGNYTFFNLLTIALCLPSLDDQVLGKVARRLGRRAASEGPAVRVCPRPLLVIVAVSIAILSVPPVASLAGVRLGEKGWLGVFPRWAAPFDVVNRYGLFAVMTTRRVEVVLEGSDDGEAWRPYVFPYKPQEPGMRPRFVEPHQPRLDWQMWFAALGTCEDSPWLRGLFARLLQGSPPVLDLFAVNPFPDRPPRLVRAVAFEYEFTDREERRRNGHWWRREALGVFCPPMALRAPPEGR